MPLGAAVPFPAQLCGDAMLALRILLLSLLLLHAIVLQAIARDVGPRELTVRQMLHSAALRSKQPTLAAATADRLARLSGLDDQVAIQVLQSNAVQDGQASGLTLGTILDLEAANHDSDKSNGNGAASPSADQRRRRQGGRDIPATPASPFSSASHKPIGE